MRTSRPGWVLALALLGGCSSVDVQTQFDPRAPFDTYRHFYFAWHEEPGSAADEGAEFRESAHRLLADLLGAKGYVESKGEKAQFLVRLQVAEENRWMVDLEDEGGIHFEPAKSETKPPEESGRPRTIEVPSPDDPGGYTVDVASIEADDVEVGDIVVEIFDAASGRVVWTGHGRALVDPTDPARELRRALEKTLEKFPPEPGSKNP